MILPPQRRGDLSNQQWHRLEPLLPAQTPETGRPSNDHRTVINGILWVLRSGARWRDLPECYGAWGTVSGRFYSWRKRGLWQQMETLQQQADIDGKLNWEIHHVVELRSAEGVGSVIRAHPHAAGAKRGS